ncbi:zf-HC2 domain-containing protein [Streptantibioticus parmotrematis]|uniref:anti-sigma factor family protein n=1 Tax=Streptantibioticus parmotrematis TaxID=2873249 RepID=UPI0033F996E4
MTGFEPFDPHVDVGAYVLGVLDASDMDRFEQHLAVCGTCSARLEELSGLVPILAEIGQDGPPRPPDGALLDRLLAEVAGERRTKRRRRRLMAVAAAALIVAGPTAAVVSMETTSSPPAASQSFAHSYTATDAGTGVSATIGLTARQWGTQIDMRLSDVGGPRTCHLVVVGTNGQQETVANWTVPPGGYASGGKPRPISVSGATAMSPSDIARFDVITTQGQKLVSVPA